VSGTAAAARALTAEMPQPKPSARHAADPRFGLSRRARALATVPHLAATGEFPRRAACLASSGRRHSVLRINMYGGGGISCPVSKAKSPSAEAGPRANLSSPNFYNYR
jgi:hypothetical protein